MGKRPSGDGGSCGVMPRGFVAGPTFRVKPGGTLSVRLINSLDSANIGVGCDVTGTQYCKAATTNLHTHGLHVSSKGSDELTYSSDDAFVEVPPGGSKDYQYSIPGYHMGGTHWYHPHFHHSTALQAGGGAAGVLIVDDPPGYLPGAYSSMVEKVLFIGNSRLFLFKTRGLVLECSRVARPVLGGSFTVTQRVAKA
ncbi:unnamed protein product [Prorocentrum cordatum]|uniref:Plastocyanin-like domain-containing protein n=1 Tax=Prorocentrum cordatum TaxID=2364126 RepID=A0ABN9SD22_9DINO|nr:unnamed protein product [Polarella glacialis]